MANQIELIFATSNADALEKFAKISVFQPHVCELTSTATSIDAQTIIFPDQVIQDFTTSITVPAFTDTVDGLYDFKGVCGEKVVTFDAGALAAFVTFTAGADPIHDSLTIALDTSSLAAAYAGVYTITYTVSFADWPVLGTHTDSFTIELIDACAGVSINAQVITFPDQVIQDFSTSVTVPAFTDSVDSTGTYT